MRKLKTGDEVIVIAGKSKGERGKITKLVGDNRVIVEGVNLMKKHVKPNPNTQEQGGIIEREAALDISNVAIYNAESDKADRVGIKINEDGTKARVFKSSGELIDA
jgi:large subunit ribosomal protein L24